MANRYFTILVIPEKTSSVRKIVVPSWALKSAAAVFALTTLLGLVMVANYWYVMSQIGENKQLKLDNRRLKQQVQVFRNKMTTIESTMERVKTFATRLKVITNIEDRNGLLQSLNQHKLPDASNNIGAQAHDAASPAEKEANDSKETHATAPAPAQPAAALQPVSALENPEEIELQHEYTLLDDKFSEMNQETLYVEQMLQDQYELLADQKAFLAALPTRKPTVGYYTSGFGIRTSPFGGRVKMHEGLDIANRPGTIIKAPADGVVLFSETKAGYGQTVILSHGYGLETWYGHTRKTLVKKGQKVRRGDSIAMLGNSGRSTGPHLHYEVRVNGYPVDPLSYILEN